MDSCITSPSLPVMVSLPLPDTITASMVSSSPPTSLQAGPAGFARVEAHDIAHHRLAHRDLAFLQAVVLALLRHEVAHRNIDLLVLGIPGQADNFHAVEQRRRNIQAVGGRSEERRV